MRRVAIAMTFVVIGLVGPLAVHADAALVGPISVKVHTDTVSDEARFVAKINELRAGMGLSQLAVDSNLTDIARNWSQQMASAGDISHNLNLKDLVGANWAKLGENVGMGPNVDSLFVAFMNSPAHYNNLVDPSWTHVGVGNAQAGGTIFTSHQFMQVHGAVVTTTPRVTVSPTTRTTSAPAPVTPRRVTTTTAPPVPAPPPPPPPPPPPEVPERVRHVMELLRAFDPGLAP